ncbi:hypothetical protein J437_LFUL017657 [Ladona fulva]|uniref:GSKIP domain-containing protein n=1 Tax=Ladona fulva TaxID=123851 RepID=A0A8K0KQG7_LADFU|nr:hypothetical protein J437_LFUL017657 [Ladona fulva]
MAKEINDVLLEEDQWKEEAAAVVQDVKDHLKEIRVSEILRGNEREIHFNLTTLEENTFCVQLSSSGFRIVSRSYDTNSISDGPSFETPYSLLNSISEKFKESFGHALEAKLQALQGT